MVRSLEKRGQLTPVVVASHGPRLVLIDGFKRQRAAEILGLSSLMVITLPSEGALAKAHMYLLNKLYTTMADDTTDDFIAKLTRLDLLIIDAVGYIRSKPEYPSILLDVVSACRHRVSLIVTSNISFQEWGQAIGNPSITNAIVDSLFDRACLINIHPGRSYRTQGPHAPKLAQTKTTDPSEHP